MKMSDLQNLDQNNPGKWPLPVKVVVMIAAAIATGYAGWHFHIQHMEAKLEKVQEEEIELRGKFERKQKKAANLIPLQAQMKEIEQSFGALLRQLPKKTEVAALLVDISQQGLASGLEFELFQPSAESQAEFYVELPIKIQVTGKYHEFGAFISGVASLPRIVTQHDVSIKTKDAKTGDLTLTSTAKTYRYVSEEEEEEGKK